MSLAVVLYTTIQNHPAMNPLLASLRHWGWPEPIVLGGQGSWMGHIHKLLTIKNHLPKLKSGGYTHVLYTDCWDVICCGPMSDISKWIGEGSLISADAGCWDGPGCERDQFPDVGTRYRYVNGGGWIGEINHLQDVLFAGAESEHCNDQWFLSRQYIAGIPNLTLDFRCEVFQPLSQVPFDVEPLFRIENGRVCNSETGTTPIFIHGAGGADLSWVPCPVKWKPISRFSK